MHCGHRAAVLDCRVEYTFITWAVKVAEAVLICGKFPPFRGYVRVKWFVVPARHATIRVVGSQIKLQRANWKSRVHHPEKDAVEPDLDIELNKPAMSFGSVLQTVLPFIYLGRGRTDLSIAENDMLVLFL